MNELERDSFNNQRLPKGFVIGVLVICITPFLLNIGGVDFGNRQTPDLEGVNNGLSGAKAIDASFYRLSGAFSHTILEWSAFMTAAFTAILAFIHFHINRDVTTPVVCMALFCAGCVDAFHTLAADRLIDAVADNTNLIPFTWAISRVFNALIMITGISILLTKKRDEKVDVERDLVFVGFISTFFILLAYSIIHICAVSETLPITMFPDALITRPWDMGPLILFCFAGFYLFPKFNKKQPGIFSHALIISMFPEIVTELHMAFGSKVLFDNHFNVAHFLKIFAYAVPFCGLMFDYIKTYREKAESEKKTGAIVDSSLNAIITIDKSGRIDLFNPAAEGMFGYKQDEVSMRNIKMLMPEPYKSKHDKYLENYLTTHTRKIIGMGIEVVAQRKDGTTFPIWLSVTEMYVNKEHQFLATIVDITKRKKADEDLRLFRNLIDRSSDCIFVIDPDSGRFTDVNSEATLSLGYEKDELLKMKVKDVALAMESEKDWKYFVEDIREKQQSIVEGLHQRKDGTSFQVEMNVKWIEEGGKSYIVAAARNVTERKKAQEVIVLAREKAEESNRLKSEFLNTMSHELRTPLTVMLGNIPLLCDPQDLPDAEEIGEIANDIEYSGKHLLVLINDLLDLSKIEAGKMDLAYEEVGISNFLKSIVEEMKSYTKERHKDIAFVLDIADFEVVADPMRLKQIFFNLLSNAVKFTDNGEITVFAESMSDRAMFYIKDTGCGIKKEYLPGIFEPFKQVDGSSTRKAGGTGLGLAITKKIVEMHRGTISVDSEEGMGSTFCFYIPINGIKEA